MKRLSVALLLLLLTFAAQAAPTEWPPAAQRLRLEGDLDTALDSLRSLSLRLSASPTPAIAPDLEEWIPSGGPLSGLGIQLLKNGDVLTWAGWSFPLEDEFIPPEGAGLSLRNYGVFRILSLTLGDAANPELQWIFDLPLLGDPDSGEFGPSPLWSGAEMGVLPVEDGSVELDPHEPWTPVIESVDGGAILHVNEHRLLRLFPLRQAPGVPSRSPSVVLLWLAAPLIALALLFLLSPKLARARGLGRGLGILGGMVLLRGAISLAPMRGAAWSPAHFSLPGWGGLFASPGDLLASTFLLFLALFLIRRFSGDPKREPSKAMALALLTILPLLLTTLAAMTGRMVLANSSAVILFEGLLPSPVGVLLFLALFFAQLALLLVLLPPARTALRLLPLPLRIPALVLPLAAACLLRPSLSVFLALGFLAIALWVPTTRRGRGEGVIWLVVPLLLFLAFLTEDVSHRQRGAFMEALTLRENGPRDSGLEQRILLRKRLGELAEDRELKGLLAAGRVDEGLALSLWKHSPLNRIEGDGALAVYDTRGHLRSLHRRGQAPRVEDWLGGGRREPFIHIEEVPSAEGEIFLRGEIALRDTLGDLGVLSLLLPRDVPTPEAALPLRSRGGGERFMAALSLLSLYLGVLALLALLDLLLAALGLPRGRAGRSGRGALGFQARLLISFLLVALLPTALIGLLGAREVLSQLDENSERAALQRVRMVRSLLENQVTQEAQDLVRSEFVRSFLVEDPLFPHAPRDLSVQARNEIMIFDDHGEIKLDEILRDWGKAEADSFLAVFPRGRIVYERAGAELHASLLVDTELRHKGARVPFSAFYRMRISPDLVSGFAEGIGGDLSLYRGGDLLFSNRPDLYHGGWIPPRLPRRSLRLLEAGDSSARVLGERGAGGQFLRALMVLPGAGGEAAGILGSLDPGGRSERVEILRANAGRVFALASLLLLLALSLGGLLSRRIFDPIRRLQLGTRRVADGDFSQRLAESGGDEIGELVSSFNRMSDRLEEAQREIVRKKRLEAWSEMARQVAHEIKNPLTPIKLSVQHMERAWRDGKPGFDEVFRDTVATLYEQVEILRRIARDFSSFGRSQKLKIETVDLAALAVDVAAPYANSALSIEIPAPESLPVRGDREALRKIILNLLENAREAMQAGGRLEISWSRSEGGAELRLRDHGPGIPEELRDKLFEPYFSTKTSGTGLGLAICAQLSDEMGGRLRLENHPEGGAVSALWLPGEEDA